MKTRLLMTAWLMALLTSVAVLGSGCASLAAAPHATTAQVITGSRIPVNPRVAAHRYTETSQTVSSYTSDDIRNSGYSDVNSFLRSRPEFR